VLDKTDKRYSWRLCVEKDASKPLSQPFGAGAANYLFSAYQAAIV